MYHGVCRLLYESKNASFSLIHMQYFVFTGPTYHEQCCESCGKEDPQLNWSVLCGWLLTLYCPMRNSGQIMFHFKNSPIPNRISRSPRCVALTNVGTIKCSSNELNSSLAPFLSFILIYFVIMIFLRIIRSKTP